MQRIRYVRLSTIIALVAAAGCRSHPESTWPSDPADVTGQVMEVRSGGGTLGTPRTGAGGYGSSTSALDGRRLRIRVLSARRQEHGPEAFVIVDGVTQVARAGATPDGSDHPDLEGAFVRVWLRSKVLSPSTSDISGAARVIAIDSIAAVPSRQ